MPDRSPTPSDLPDAVVEALADLSPAALRRTARYAETLAARREEAAGDDRTDHSRRPESEPNDADATATRPTDQPRDPPDDVPAKATLTVKEINENRYYYWQWREGESIKSTYEGPVDPS